MSLCTPEDVELIWLGWIDVEDLPLSEFNRKSTSPHLDIFRDINFMQFHLVCECEALIICLHSTINVTHHFFIFQNPLCHHFCSMFSWFAVVLIYLWRDWTPVTECLVTERHFITSSACKILVCGVSKSIGGSEGSVFLCHQTLFMASQ